jgi:hypothetical protein
MNKAMLVFLTMGLALASVAANAESEMARHRLRAGEIESRADSVQAFNGSRVFVGDRDERDARSDRSFEASRQITKPRSAAQPAAVAAPEIDPSSAAGGLTLLLGGIAVLLGRRTRPD